MTSDLVLDAARATLADMPDADRLLADLKAQLALAAATQAQLRADLRGLVAQYRVWRREACCGRETANILPLHPTYLKQLRRVWATYRLTQLLLRNMQAMAGLRAQQTLATQRLRIAPATKIPANESVAGFEGEFDQDGISYDELEDKYGPVLAQRLYDEITAQLRQDRLRAQKH